MSVLKIIDDNEKNPNLKINFQTYINAIFKYLTYLNLAKNF